MAISNGRLLELNGDHVVYRYKNHREQGQWRVGRLHGVEFVRRFTQHILPPGFARVRYYGLISNRRRRETVEACRAEWGEPSVDDELAQTLSPEEGESGPPVLACSIRGATALMRLETVTATPGLRPRAPP